MKKVPGGWSSLTKEILRGMFLKDKISTTGIQLPVNGGVHVRVFFWALLADEEALAAMSTCSHNLAIVDISLDGDSGLALIKTLRQRYPELAILTLSMHDESLFAERALRSGANGYLMKQEGTQNILLAVQQILAGSIYLSAAMHSGLTQRLVTSRSIGRSPIAGLSEREFEILHLIGLGFGTRQIAEKLKRSVKTIEAHRANLKEKLQLKSGRDLVRYAVQVLEAS